MAQIPNNKPNPTPPPKPNGPGGGSASPDSAKPDKPDQKPQFSKDPNGSAGNQPAPKPEPPKTSREATPPAPKPAETPQPASKPTPPPTGGNPDGPPKSSKDILRDQQRNGDARQAETPTTSAHQGAGPATPEAGEKPTRGEKARENVQQKAEQGIDGALGSGASKDLKGIVAKEDKHGDKTGLDERGISAAKTAGRAANAVWGGNNKAINKGIDKVGDAMSAGARYGKRKRRELKNALTGKQLMDAASGESINKKKAPSGSTANQQSDDADDQGGEESSPKKDKKPKKGSGSGEASGTGKGKAKKIGLGCGALVMVAFLLIVVAMGGALGTTDGQPGDESDEAVMEYIPGGEEGWYEVATWSVDHQEFEEPPHEIPWTLIMGLAAEQTDLGRFSPYDATDRDPDRDTTPIVSGSSGGSSGANTGNVNIQNTGDADRSNPAWRQQIVMQAFVDSGFTPEQAAGIVGNMITESGVEPTKAEEGKGFPSTWGWGLVQWTFERNTTIVNKVQSELGEKFYTDNPADLNDDEWFDLLELQIGHVIEELDTTHAHAGDPLRASTTAEEASTIILSKYEVPADIPGNRPVRAAQSEEVLRVYEAGGLDAITDGEVAVNITREEAEYLTFNTEDHVRVEPVATRQCAVPNPEPAIGGGEGEGVGPYLLSEDAATEARKAGYDPQSPCVGRWIANQLAGSISDVNKDDADYKYHMEAPWPFGEGMMAGTGSGSNTSSSSGGGGNIGSGDGSVQHPLEGAPAPTGAYGPRDNPTGPGTQMHKGADWAVPGGTPVGAVADGVVSHTNPNTDGSGWGNYIVIDHNIGGEEVQSLYAHLQEAPFFNPGDEVKAGDVVGPVGTTGDSTGDHLHLEIIVNGQHTDPEPWLAQHMGGDSNISHAIGDLVESGNVSNSRDGADEEDTTSDDAEETTTEEEESTSDDEEETTSEEEEDTDSGSEETSREDDADLTKEEEEIRDFEDNVDFWSAVVRKTDIFADRHSKGETCVLEGGDDDNSHESYAQQIIYSFHCEIAKIDNFEVVEKAFSTTPDEDASEEEIEEFQADAVFQIMEDRYEAERRIIEEALQVSFTASGWEAEGCDADSERAGIFQLTADEMKDGGFDADDRCDSAQSAAAAAKLFVDGETKKVESRSNGDGPYEPALGGWDNISVALGTEDRDDFVNWGSGSSAVSTGGRCTESMENWVTHVADEYAGEEEGFHQFNGMEDATPEEQREHVRRGVIWSDEAQGGGSFLGFGGNNLPPHLTDDCVGGSARDYAEQLGEVAASVAAEEEDEEKRDVLTGFSTWAGWLNASEGGKPVVGKSSLVARLSAYNYDYPDVPMGHDSLSQMVLDEVGGRDGYVPLDQRAVEYAIFFGGLSQPFDTAKRIYGSLEEAVSSGGSVGMAGGNSADVAGCPVEPGPIPGALEGGAEDIGINELCRRAVDQARNDEAAIALIWAFQQVGVQMYSQPMRMDEMHSDCSSLISRAYQEAAGVQLYEPGGNAWTTWTFVEEEGAPQVPMDELVPGDWFEPSDGHIVFVISDGFILHASQPGQPIKIGKFYTGDYNVGGTIDPSAYPSVEPIHDVGGPGGEGATDGPLNDAVADLEERTGAKISVSIANGDGTQSGGSLSAGPAWSTIKVPLGIAAVRNDPGMADDARAAITVSDNDAAQRLWDSLGGGEQAAAAVEEVLKEGGDSTSVNATATRPEFSIFGQTNWSTAAQAEFATQLRSIADSDVVVGAMGQITGGHSYGLGQISNAEFKGGWGPNESGQYLVRQFGMVGDTGVAVAVEPSDGTYESGQSVLNDLAGIVESHM